MISIGRITRIALMSAAICVTVGASGVLATMTWQVPGDTKGVAEATAEEAAERAASPSLIMTAANAYLDSQSAKMAALQAISTRTVGARGSSEEAPAKDMASFAQFERKCLKKVSKRRNAKLVRVPCSPLQGEFAGTIATADTPAAIMRKTSRRSPSSAFARQIQ